MSIQYIVTLSDAENKALGHVAISQQEWIDNAVHSRCGIAIEEIVNREIQRKLALGETISGSKDDIVMAADIKSAIEQQAEAESSLQAIIDSKS